MLNLMRKRAGSWMIKIILFAIVVVFSFWGVGSMRNSQVAQVAEVNDEAISRTAYADAYNQLRDNYRRAYGDQLNESVMQMLRPGEQALNQLISRVLMLQQAERLDLSVADQELITTIQKMPAFQENGLFSQDRYRGVLAQNNTSPEQFEQSYKEELLIDKLRKLILNGVMASEEEALAWYQMNNAEVSVDYVLFAPASYKNIDTNDDALAAYFKENESQYRTAPRVKARYIHFDANDYKAGVSISDDAVAEYYQGHPEQFSSEKTIAARHILFKFDSEADDTVIAQRRTQAMDVYKLAKQGRDFAELATQYSEGPSKDKGGDLGTFARDAMVKPFADKAFSMQSGEISEPVQTQFGWHLIKVEKVNEASSKSIEEVTAQIRNQLVIAKARDLARDKAEEVYDSVFDGDDLTDAGKTYQVPVRTTAYFTSEGIRQGGIDDPQKFTKIAFGLKKMDISDIETIGDGYYLIQVSERAEPVIPEFATVATKVSADFIKARQNEQAQSDATALIAKLKEGVSLAEASQAYKKTPAATGFFKRSGAIPDIGYETQITQAAFQLFEQSPLAEQAINGKAGWYVIQLKARKVPPAQGFDKEKVTAMKQLTDQKKRDTFQRWVADLRARSTVTINKEQLMTP